MTSKDNISSLVNVYQLLHTPKAAAQTSYTLQFLWHDLISSYDIIGPYFTSADSVDSKFILTCVLKTIKLLQHHWLKTSLLVCDGCAVNLATIKAIHEHCGAYSIIDDEFTDRFEVQPWFINLFAPPSLIFWMIFPTH